MKSFILFLAISLLAVSCSEDPSPSIPSTSNTLNIKFIQEEEAASLLIQEDETTNQWSKFDMILKLDGKEGSKKDALAFAAQQARQWTQNEMDFLNIPQNIINQRIKEKGFQLRYPQEIPVLKTTTIEEGKSAGYTRDNYIVINERVLSLTVLSTVEILAHESFHILTKTNPEFRKQTYAIIGFNILPREVEFPQELKDRMISNPDVFSHDSYATFTINGQKTDCTMVLFSDRPYTGGRLFEYIKIGLAAIDKEKCKAIEKDGKAVIYSIDDATDFFEKVGYNTNYIYDPEEILAKNFGLIFTEEEDLRNPEIVEKIEKVCRSI